MGKGDLKLKKVLDGMERRGLGGLVIYSGGTCSVMSPSYLYYFSGFKPLGRRNSAVVSRSGEVALLIEPKWDQLRAQNKSWIKDIRGTSNFLRDMRGILQDFKVKGPIGLVGSKEMNIEAYNALRREWEVKIADDLIEEIAREKTEEELAIVREVSRIADIGFRAFLEHARVGVREFELVAETEYAMRFAGADDIFILMSSGPHNYEMHEPTDRRLRNGDLVIGEITPGYEGQFVQLCETVVLGKPEDVVVEKFGMLVRSLEESLASMKPGMEASVLAKSMNRVISEAGYAQYCYPPYMRARGHGFGVGSIAPGAGVDEETKEPLEKGQVIVVHPNQYLPETGYLACGETVLVGENGVQRLTEVEPKLYVKEG